MAHLSEEIPGDERSTLLLFVESQRTAIRESLAGLTEEQAASRPSASELSLSGLVKHVAEVELAWLRMAQQQPNEIQRDRETWSEAFLLVGAETVPSVQAFWEGVTAELTAFVRDLPSLDETFPLPMRRPGSPRTARSRCAGCCCTWWRSSRGTRATRTSSGSPSTAPRPWDSP